MNWRTENGRGEIEEFGARIGEIVQKDCGNTIYYLNIYISYIYMYIYDNGKLNGRDMDS